MKRKKYILRAIADVAGLLLCVAAYVKHTPYPADPPKYPADILGAVIRLLGLIFVLLFVRNCVLLRREKAPSEKKKDADKEV